MSGVKHGILGRLSSVRDDSLKRVDEVQSSITNTLDTGFEALGGGSKLEDCFLQVDTILVLRCIMIIESSRLCVTSPRMRRRRGNQES